MAVGFTRRGTAVATLIALASGGSLIAQAAPAPPAATAVRKDEARIVGVLEDLFKNQRQGMMSVPPEDGRLLRVLAAAGGARQVVEIGTSNGYSGLWLCLALQATGGK